MRRTTHPVRAALAVIATIAVIVSVVVWVDGRVGYVNVPNDDELTAVGLEPMAHDVTILEDHEAAAAMPATVRDATQALDGPPFIVVSTVGAGESRWCRRLAVDYHRAADGDIQLSVTTPLWARLRAWSCAQDVPAPGAVVVSVPADHLMAADEVIVDYGAELGSITCAPSPPQMRPRWSCDPAPSTRRD